MKKSEPISFRLPQELKAALVKLAKDDERSLSAYITLALRKHVAALAAKKGPRGER